MKKKVIFIGGAKFYVTGLYHNSKDVEPGGVYFALRDGRYINEAITNGASVIVASRKVNGTLCAVVKDVREIMALSAKQFYGSVCNKMRITAVVGTNGKTTTAYILKHILETATGKNVGLIGTIGIFGTEHPINGSVNRDGILSLTTPDPINLHRALFAMYKNGIRDVVMEVSAHAVYYKKIAGIKFFAAIFTNVTQDHLDFFGDFDHYKKTKISFLQTADISTIIANADDPAAKEIPADVSYSLDNKHIAGVSRRYLAEAVVLRNGGSDFILNGQSYHIPVAGKFNVYNAVAAVAAAGVYGISAETAGNALASFTPVPGRFNTCDIDGVTVIIDYAHTPDGLEKILINAKMLLPFAGKLISVFGCGGGRDRIKRPIMGRISYNLADFTVITSDNPRTESAGTIIAEIERGIKADCIGTLLDDMPTKYITEPDREKAIRLAVKKAKPGDIVAVLGKGHEEYMDIGGVKIPYSDAKVLDNIKNGN
jgi:UDP-N-acetylmuramoyl-L-alanyl-D-glutamate--2,6-diaminopimelate ligase